MSRLGDWLSEERLKKVLPPSALRRRLGLIYRGLHYRGLGLARSPLNRHCKDFFASDLLGAMPDTVYVLGSGPNGRNHYHEIPPDAYVIALNQAVLIESVPEPSLWMVVDWRCLSRAWWSDAMKKGVPRVFGRELACLFGCDYSFKAYPSLEVWHPRHQRYCPIDSALRVGATVAGCAIQAAYHAGCRRVVLCGIDMFGHLYFDGTVSFEERRNKTWPGELEAMNQLVAGLKRRGMDVTSLSETSIELD